MDFWGTIRLALRTLARNKMRSILTMLGIVIGVGAVIAMVSVGQGAAQQTQEQIQSFGTNTVFVASGSVNRGGMRLGAAQTKTLTIEDLQAILRQIPLIRSGAPGVGASAQVVYGNLNWATRILGTTPEYFEIRNWPVQAGTLFSDEDVDTAQDVCVLGQTVAANLFEAENPVGKTIRIGNLPFHVLGVMSSKGQSGMGNDQDDQIWAPFTTVQKKIAGITWVQFLSLSAISREASTSAQVQIRQLLRERHHLRPEEDDDFFIRTQSDVEQLAEQTGRIFTMLLGSIASVSLIVGGIGIMNIMLVSVTERTREIGIRIAVGATERDIHWQFLLEAMTLSIMGGMAGILFGWTGASLLSSILRWPTLISPLAIGVAVLFSVGIGVFFGYYPAKKAAQMNPIEALRYE
jgi:putative ABC transport system permease protein